MRKVLGCLILCWLTGCVPRHLDVQTLYLTSENLASAIVCTPDLATPSIGQRLLVQWNLRRKFFSYQHVFFKLTLRFRNHQEHIICKQIKTKQGAYLYELIGNPYEQLGGVVTYYLEIFGDGCLIDSWQHPLWAKLITFDASSQKKALASCEDPLID